MKSIWGSAILTVFVLFFETASSAFLFAEESWGTKMFEIKKHDFGRVAIGADAEFRFPVHNIYTQEIKILGVHSSCGCTDPSVTQNVLKSNEHAEVVARFNTSGQHTRDKSAVLSVDMETVVDGKLLRDTVQLSVSGYIRPDVVLTPGIVEFGSVPAGETVVRTHLLEYAGRNDWALVKVERTNPFVHARAEEIKRSGGEISYKITVTLKPNAPIGYVKDALRFKTNERTPGTDQPTEIVLPIQGMVTAPIHANPSPLMIGVLSSGEIVSKNIIVRGDKAFRVMDVTAEDPRFRFSFANQESSIQLISVLFSAKRQVVNEPIKVSDTIRIRTSLPDQEFITVQAQAQLLPRFSSPQAETMQSDFMTNNPESVVRTESDLDFPSRTDERPGAETVSRQDILSISTTVYRPNFVADSSVSFDSSNYSESTDLSSTALKSLESDPEFSSSDVTKWDSSNDRPSISMRIAEKKRLIADSPSPISTSSDSMPENALEGKNGMEQSVEILCREKDQRIDECSAAYAPEHSQSSETVFRSPGKAVFGTPRTANRPADAASPTKKSDVVVRGNSSPELIPSSSPNPSRVAFRKPTSFNENLSHDAVPSELH